MDIKGVWKIKYFSLAFGDIGEAGVLQSVEDKLKSADEDEREQFEEIAGQRYIFDEDTYRIGIVITDELKQADIDEAVKSGEMEPVGEKYLVMPQRIAYEPDGDGFKTELADVVEGLDEKTLESLKRIKVVDGMLVINAIFGLYYLVRE